MNIIYRATSNNFYTTCVEKQALVSPSYIIKFTEDAGKNERYCAVTDSSSYPARYQAFTIIETNTPTPVSNQIKLNIAKSWTYIVYEITSAALALITDLTAVDYSTLNEVHRGRARVLDVTVTSPQVYSEYQSTMKTYAG